MNLYKPILIFMIFFNGVLMAQYTTGNDTLLLTLDDAINIAGKNSPSILQSRLNMEKNKELLNAQLAYLKTQFNLDVSPFSFEREQSYDERTSQWYTNENKGGSASFIATQPIKWTNGLVTIQDNFGYQNNYSDVDGTTYTDIGFNNYFFIQYDQPLFTYNETKVNLDKIKLNLETATLAYAIEMLNMEYQVNSAFYSVYQQKSAVAIAEDELKNQTKSLEIIRAKVEAGLSAQEELMQGELNYTTAKSDLDNAIVELQNYLDQFKLLIGISLFNNIDIIADIDFNMVYINLQKAIDNGLAKRLEISQRNIELKQAEYNLIETSSENEFRGDISLSLGIMGNNEYLKEVYETPTNSPTANITFSIPLFDWGARKAQIKAAELDIQSCEIDIEDQKNDIIINIRETYRNIQNLVYQIEIAKQNERNAQLTYEINLERYQNGDLTSMDLQLYQNQLSEKKTALVNALIDYRLEIINMKVQSLWDFENDCSFVPKELQENLQSKNN